MISKLFKVKQALISKKLILQSSLVRFNISQDKKINNVWCCNRNSLLRTNSTSFSIEKQYKNQKAYYFKLYSTKQNSNLLHCQNNNFSTMKFYLPDLGQKIKQGTVKTLYVSQGDKVQEFQKLSDVQSDKQFTEITAPATGIIKKIHYKQAQVCKVGDLFLELEVEGQIPFQNQQKEQTVTKSASPSASNKQQKSSTSKQINHNYGHSILTSPTVIKIAKENSIDLRNVKGSGKKGRITKQDLIFYIQNPTKYTISSLQSSQSNQVIQQSGLSQILKSHSQKADRKIGSSLGYGEQTIISLKPAQIHNCKLMNQSVTVPHLYFTEEFDVTQSQKMRQIIKKYYQKSGIKISMTAILIKTLSMALRKHPRINSLYYPGQSEFQFHIQNQHNVSFALDTQKHGLLYPTLSNVNNLNMIEINEQLKRIKQLSQTQSLKTLQQNGYLNQGSICISNVGTVGGLSANSKLIPPQVCIIAFGKMKEQPKKIQKSDGQIQYRKRKIINATLGCDHRVLDGASVARFCIEWKKYVQNPYLLMQQFI